MPSNRTPTRFYGPAVPSSTPGVLYTVPANKIAVIRQLVVLTDGTDGLQLGVGGTSDAVSFYQESWTEAGTTKEKWYYYTLTEGETINGFSIDDSPTLTISGDLYDE